MKAVMISVQPRWCEKIAVRDKSLEVRKTKPNIQTPFKCYIYQTRRSWVYKLLEKLRRFKWAQVVMNGQGKVIGEFICDRIAQILILDGQFVSMFDCRGSCLTVKEILEYSAGKRLYGWHISNIVIYDKPKPLSNFTPICKYRNDDMTCQSQKVGCVFQELDNNQDGSLNLVECTRRLTRPPQSWYYVEELEGGED